MQCNMGFGNEQQTKIRQTSRWEMVLPPAAAVFDPTLTQHWGNEDTYQWHSSQVEWTTATVCLMAPVQFISVQFIPLSMSEHTSLWRGEITIISGNNWRWTSLATRATICLWTMQHRLQVLSWECIVVSIIHVHSCWCDRRLTSSLFGSLWRLGCFAYNQ